MSNGTASNPGYLFELAGALVAQMPRNLSKNVALNWINNQAILRSRLEEALRIVRPIQESLSSSTEFEHFLSFEILIPNNYNHQKAIDNLYPRGDKCKYCVDSDIQNLDCSKVSHQLVPGKVYVVRVYKTKKELTLSECTKRLTSTKGVFAGIQGISLVLKYALDYLSSVRRCDWAIYFPDFVKSLPVDEKHVGVVPHVFHDGDNPGDWFLNAGLMPVIYAGSYVACFHDPSSQK